MPVTARAACLLALLAACAGARRTSPPAQRPEAEAVLLDGAGDGHPSQGEPCREGRCAPGLTCVRYHGVAGRAGPTFASCEIPCAGPRSACPEGQACVTVADGPGTVCRPR